MVYRSKGLQNQRKPGSRKYFVRRGKLALGYVYILNDKRLPYAGFEYNRTKWEKFATLAEAKEYVRSFTPKRVLHRYRFVCKEVLGEYEPGWTATTPALAFAAVCRTHPELRDARVVAAYQQVKRNKWQQLLDWSPRERRKEPRITDTLDLKHR